MTRTRARRRRRRPARWCFSTVGNANPAGVGGTADDADIYGCNGTTYSRDVRRHGGAGSLPAGANVDGYDRVDATHFYMSFSADHYDVPGLGVVQDEDVVYYNDGTWSVYFDGTAHGLTAAGQDIDAINGGRRNALLLHQRQHESRQGPGDRRRRRHLPLELTAGTLHTGLGRHRRRSPGQPTWTARPDRRDALLPLLQQANTTVPGSGRVQDEDVVHYGTAPGPSTSTERPRAGRHRRPRRRRVRRPVSTVRSDR